MCNLAFYASRCILCGDTLQARSSAVGGEAGMMAKQIVYMILFIITLYAFL